MSLPTESEAQAIIQKVLSYSKADECQVELEGVREGNVRFARNTVSTSGGASTLKLQIRSSFGRRSGSTQINEFDDASLEKAARRAEELAKLAPENPESVELIGPQTYLETNGYVPATADMTADTRADLTAASIKVCKDQGLVGAGFLAQGARALSIGNSKGLRGFQRLSGINFSVTTRTPDGKGSGYGVADFNDAKLLDSGAVTTFSAKKAALSRDARAIEPGKYTVVLEPAASADLLCHMVSAMNARSTDEGRSFLSKPGGGSRLGEKIMDERVTISSDPQNAQLPGDKWAADGRPHKPVDWIKNGVVSNLAYTRYWARKKGLTGEGTPGLGRQGSFGGGISSIGGGIGGFEGQPGIIMAGGTANLDELVKSVKRGILVTRMWYIRPVDPQTLLYTGLTRDGTFYIEDGQVKYAVKNFRFNESPVIMLNNLETLGRPERANACLVPPMVVRDFTFSSLSDAV
jgi:predicted Zn-dependent protease